MVERHLREDHGHLHPLFDIKTSIGEHHDMRTTLTLDDDVAAGLKTVVKTRKRPFKMVVNEALRAGLAVIEKRAAPRRPYRTRGFDLGPSLVGSLDNIEDVVSRVEGEPHT
jgi:hypothetical protein